MTGVGRHRPVPQTPGVPDHAAPEPKGALMASVRKFAVAALGTAAMVVSTGVLEEDVEVWVTAVLAVATALGVYSAKNAPAAPSVRDENLRA